MAGRRRRRRRRKSEFRERLKGLGYRSYSQYLKSEHWEGVKARYRRSKRPKVCACCGDPNYQLHHNTYERLGKERLTDFTPLCDVCHTGFHRYLRAHKELKLSDTDLILEALREKRKKH
jgi:hypothetical protein